MRLFGSITALATPFDPAGAIDWPAWRSLIDTQLEAGTQALVVAGSTGEAAALDEAEYVALIRAAVAQVGGRVPILAGTGQSATRKTVAQTRLAREAGADLALVVTPPYVRPTQAGLLAHYRAVAADGGLPVLLYNVPGRTGCDLAPETAAELATVPGIVGVKEARGDAARIAALAPLSAPGFAVLSGDDPSFVAAMQAGYDGVISVASNVFPRAFRRLCELCRAGDRAAAAALDSRLRPGYDFLGIEPNPIPVKAALAALGIGHGLRLPLLPLSDTHRSGLRDLLALVAAVEAETR